MRDIIESTIKSDAESDDAFRAALLADPSSALESRYGIEVPAGLSVRVIAEDRNEVVIVLPSRDEPELSESDLDRIQGASDYTQGDCVPIGAH